MPHRPPTPHVVTRRPKPYWCECSDKRIKGVHLEAEECEKCSIEYGGKRYAERLLDAPRHQPRPLPFDDCEKQCSCASPPPTPQRAKFLAMEATRHDRHRVHFEEPNSVCKYHSLSQSHAPPPIREMRATKHPINTTMKTGTSQNSSASVRTLPKSHMKPTTRLPLVQTRGFVVTNPSSDESSPTESDPPWTPPPDADFTPQAPYAPIPEWPEYARPAPSPAFGTTTFYAVSSPLPLAACTYLPPAPSDTQGVIPNLPQQQKLRQKTQTRLVSEVKRKH